MTEDPKTEVGLAETPNPGQKEKDEVTAWLRTLNAAERFRDKIGEEAGWKRFIDEFKGNWAWLQQTVKIALVPINLVYAYVKTEIARLYFRDPWISVNAKHKESVGGSQIGEQAINYTWGDLKLKSEMKACLLEGLVVGHSWMKTGYVAEFGTVESQPAEPRKGPGRPKKTEVDPSEYLKSENVFAYHVPYDNVVFDTSATYPPQHHARWMAHKIVKPLRAIKKSGLYKHADEIRPSASVESPNVTGFAGTGDQVEENKDVVNAILWEIYNLDDLKVLTVSPGCEYKLREIDYPDYLFDGEKNPFLPFDMLAFNPIIGSVYPLSDVAPHEPQIIELIKMQAIELNHLKRWNRQIFTSPDFFSKEEEEKFIQGNDGAVIKVNTTAGASLESNFYIPPYAPVQQDVYGVWNQVFDVWKNVAGQSSTERGAAEKNSTRTLGELRLQLQGGRARADEKIDMLEDFIESVARKLLLIMKKKFDLPKIARIVGDETVRQKVQGVLAQRPSAQPTLPSGDQNPVADQSMTSDFSFSWNKLDLLGEMDVNVVAGSTVPMDKEAQLEILEKLAPFLPALGAPPGSPAARAYGREYIRLIGIKALESVMDIADKTPPTPDPEMQKMQAEQQIAQQQAQIEMQISQQQAQMDMQMTQAEIDAKKQEAQVQLQAQIQETQAKLQGLNQEQQIKIQGQADQQGLKRQGMEQKLAHDREKNKIDIQKSVIQAALIKARGAGEKKSNGN